MSIWRHCTFFCLTTPRTRIARRTFSPLLRHRSYSLVGVHLQREREREGRRRRSHKEDLQNVKVSLFGPAVWGSNGQSQTGEGNYRRHLWITHAGKTILSSKKITLKANFTLWAFICAQLVWHSFSIHDLLQGMGHFEHHAREDLGPFADRMEEQMRPALKQMHRQIGSALGSFTDQEA